MAFNTKTIYAINKKEPNKIIYPSVDGTSHYLELRETIVYEVYINSFEPKESYTKIRQEIDIEKFKFFKEFSDNDYHTTEKADYKYQINKVSINNLEETNLGSEKSVFEELLEPIDNIEKEKMRLERRKKGLEIFDKLTEIQKKRYKMNVVEGKKAAEIAELEGVNRSSISRSLDLIEKKIEKNRNFF